jgi:phosphoglycolate phosphatase
MTHYRLAIFDFDGTLADSLPWFRASFQDMITRFDLAPVRDDEVEGLRGMSAREIMARLNVSMWQLPAIVSDMRKRKLAAASETSLFAGIPAMLSDLQRLGIKTAIVSSDSEASVRQVLGPATSLITSFDCGAAIFGKHWKFRRVARRLGTEPADTICIGDEIRDIEAAKAADMDSGAVAWGYALPTALQAAGPTHLFNSIEEMMQRLTLTTYCVAECPLDSSANYLVIPRGHRTRCSWPFKLRTSTNSATFQPIGSIGYSSTLRASYNNVTCGVKFVLASRLNPLRVIAAPSICRNDCSLCNPFSPIRTNGRLPSRPRKLAVRSNETSNGSVRTSMAASHAAQSWPSGNPLRANSEMCSRSGAMSLPSK